MAQDSTGMIRGLFEEGWVALFDDSKEKSKFWLIGMINYNFIGINLVNLYNLLKKIRVKMNLSHQLCLGLLIHNKLLDFLI